MGRLVLCWWRIIFNKEKDLLLLGEDGILWQKQEQEGFSLGSYKKEQQYEYMTLFPHFQGRCGDGNWHFGKKLLSWGVCQPPKKWKPTFLTRARLNLLIMINMFYLFELFSKEYPYNQFSQCVKLRWRHCKRRTWAAIGQHISMLAIIQNSSTPKNWGA